METAYALLKMHVKQNRNGSLSLPVPLSNGIIDTDQVELIINKTPTSKTTYYITIIYRKDATDGDIRRLLSSFAREYGLNFVVA